MLKKTALIVLFIGIIILGRVTRSYGWGFWAHEQINRCAVFTLPDEMRIFYKKNIDFITIHSVDPDKRTHSDKKEGGRHYIDADHYGASPFDSIPKSWDKAVAKFSQDTLEEYGINPWYIALVTQQLTRAFVKGHKDSILILSAELGHYIADAHVPLHSTMNYDGQLTNQKGIHSFWETRLPELFGAGYNYHTRPATYLQYPLAESWRIIQSSFSMLDTVLRFERQLNEQYPKEKKYTAIKKSGKVYYDYSEEYSRLYHEMLHHMVERRMRAAIRAVGSYWFTAWVNAGKPDLNKIDTTVLTGEKKKQLDSEEALWKSGKIIKRDRFNP